MSAGTGAVSRTSSIDHSSPAHLSRQQLQLGSAKEAFEALRANIEARASGKGPTFYDMLNPKSTEAYEALLFLIQAPLRVPEFHVLQ